MKIIFKKTKEQLIKDIIFDIDSNSRAISIVEEIFSLSKDLEYLEDDAAILDRFSQHYLLFGNNGTTYLWNDYKYVGKQNPIINYWLGGLSNFGRSAFKMYYNTITRDLFVGY